jgi:hypothetical protein
VAELRSFIIGVTIAGLFLLVGGLAFGLFGDDTSGSPSVRLLGTPPATRTPPPATTRDPSELTPVPPSATSETATTGTQAAGNTPSAIQTATPTLEVAPTADVEPTEAPPVVDPVDDYIAAANQYAPALLAQIEYLLGNASAPNITATDWRTFTLESAQNIQALAGALAGIAAPGCVSGAHGSLVAAANEASAAAGQVAAGVNANDAAAVGAATGPLGAAQSLVGGAVTEVSNTLGSAC